MFYAGLLKWNWTKKDWKEILFEHVHPIRKSNSNNSKPRPLIAKFTFHNDKEFVLGQAKNLRGTNFAVARDFTKEIVKKRKLLVPTIKGCKEEQSWRQFNT